MKTLGLDIGTTTISAVVYDGQTADSRTVDNGAFLPGEIWEKIQDPDIIYNKALESVKVLLERNPNVSAIGLTGQMHGIVYLDKEGNPVSPLYIWQDGRGDLPFEKGVSWAAHLSQLTGYPLATGYGMVTHYYNLNHDLIPKDAAVFCTIHDYVAMKLAGRTEPLIDPTDAASLGLYNAPEGCFDLKAMEKTGISSDLVPKIMKDPCLGTGELGIPVYAGIGDNQASFLGATDGRTDALLVNVGTGSQISVYSPRYIQTDTLETRPFPDGGWLLVGASLCGGRSYALLEKFFGMTVKLVTGKECSTYGSMSELLDSCPEPEDIPVVDTTFQGTRKDPSLRGSVQNLDIHNFTPLHLIYGFMHGMADELFGMYRGYLESRGKPIDSMIGSGNGLRKNPHLCRIFETTFGCPMTLSGNNEEAACGAAIYAARHCENRQECPVKSQNNWIFKRKKDWKQRVNSHRDIK